MLTRFLNWWNGWRVDLDDWLVRARKATDPDPRSCDVYIQGFIEEACIAVSSPEEARAIDTGRWREECQSPYIFGYSGDIIVAEIRQVRDRDCWHTRNICFGESGEEPTLEAAKSAAEQAFKAWCERAGLVSSEAYYAFAMAEKESDAKQAMLAEREACAQVAEAMGRWGRDFAHDSLYANLRRELAAEIRARSKPRHYSETWVISVQPDHFRDAAKKVDPKPEGQS